jgi:hypothetical protein
LNASKHKPPTTAIAPWMIRLVSLGVSLDSTRPPLFLALIGPPGPKGEVGPKGDKGARGETGDVGPKGDVGPRGDPGPRGEIGIPGPRGERGDVGPKGEKGDTGLKGESGPKAERGEPGADGRKGEAGARGEAGPKGDKGDAGPRGEKGDPGLRGEKGDTGSRGEIGLKGDKGDPGVKGEKGDAGTRGETGLKGEKGDPGTPCIQAGPATDVSRTCPVPPTNNSGSNGGSGTDKPGQTQGPLTHPGRGGNSAPATGQQTEKRQVDGASSQGNAPRKKRGETSGERTMSSLQNPVLWVSVLILCVGAWMISRLMPPRTDLPAIFRLWRRRAQPQETGQAQNNSPADDNSTQNTFPNPYAPHAIQILGLTFLLPVLLIVFTTSDLGNEALVALLGSMIGYLFGSTSSATPNRPDEKTGFSRGGPSTSASSTQPDIPPRAPS